MKQTLESVQLPTVSAVDTLITGFRAWALYLTPLFRDLGFRVNRCLPKDGSEGMTQPLRLAPFTTATRPAAATWPGSVIYVSDGAAGAKIQASDGTNWVLLG